MFHSSDGSDRVSDANVDAGRAESLLKAGALQELQESLGDLGLSAAESTRAVANRLVVA